MLKSNTNLINLKNMNAEIARTPERDDFPKSNDRYAQDRDNGLSATDAADDVMRSFTYRDEVRDALKRGD